MALRLLAKVEWRLPRLTKSEIESALLSGGTVEWTDAAEKRAVFHLSDAKQRRLLVYLLSSKVRQPTNLPETFVAGLQAAFDAVDDPAAQSGAASAPGAATGPWRLHSIETEGFGGLNSWKGAPFEFEFNGESFLLEGPNGSGKSSLIGALIWALVGAQIAEALVLLRKSKNDTRFQLKALGARWHDLHASGPIENCPLCQLDLKDRKELAKELESLRSIGDAATKAFEDNINAIISKLEAAIPTSLRKSGPELLAMEPRGRLLDEVRAAFMDKARYADCLIKVAALVGGALNSAPSTTLAATKAPEVPADAPATSRVLERIAIVERLVALGQWFEQNADGWTEWWNALAQGDEAATEEPTPGSEPKAGKERLISHLDRLSDALEKSGPYRNASEAMRNAWKAGRTGLPSNGRILHQPTASIAQICKRPSNQLTPNC